MRSISVLILDDNGNYDALKVLYCLGRVPEVKSYILSRTMWPMARFSRYCAGCHYHTSQNDDDWIDTIKSMVRKWDIDVVLPVTMRGVSFVARNRTAISEFAAISPVTDVEFLKMVLDKWLFHVFAVQHGFPVPAAALIGVLGETSIASKHFDSIGYPALLKPTMLGGGFGIVKVKEPSDLDRAWNDERIKKGCQYMLQSYVPGVDLCLQVFCKGGEIIEYTVQKSLMLSENYFGPQRIMEFAEDNGTVELGRRLVSAMGFEGIACIDFRIDALDQTQKILEINPRIGQAILGSMVAGVNFPLLACVDALGLEYPLMQYKTVKYAHPLPSLKIILSRLIGRSTVPITLWRESGLRFTCNDPIPAIVNVFRRTTRRLKRYITGSRSLS
jgi:predicted ATP-grasp superfamily ATP-dependent carboligase